MSARILSRTVYIWLLMSFAMEGSVHGDDKPILADPYRAGRTMTMSQHGIVASSHVLASMAGVDMLRGGGNAVDAAVAAAATLAVVEPHMTGLGGDMWMLYYEAKSGKVYGLNGSGRSPMGLTREYFDSKEEPKIDDSTWEAVTVPGAVDGWASALDRFGSKEFDEVLAPAIRYAEEGFPVAEIVGAVWKVMELNLRRDEWARKTYLVDDRAPEIGSIFKNPNLGQTLRLIAEGGRDAFYKGPIAKEIVRYAQESGGWLTTEDFANHSSTWVEPISTNYRGYDVYQCPPNGQGVAVLLMLNILENFDLKSMTLNSPDYLHLLLEAKKLAYADVYQFIGDPEKGDIPLDELLSKEYGKKQAKRIDTKKAAERVDPGLPEGGDTIYLTTIDREGNACSFINSLYAPFGSKIVGGSTGVKLQNRGDGFTLEKGHINEYAPGKRPFHTIIPGMVLKDGGLYLSYGLMGGDMQPQGHVQYLLGHFEHGLTIQEANDMPRWRHYSGREIRVEYGTPQGTFDALEALGHEVRWGNAAAFGGAQAVMVDPETGTYFGSSDSRKDGAAIGY